MRDGLQHAVQEPHKNPELEQDSQQHPKQEAKRNDIITMVLNAGEYHLFSPEVRALLETFKLEHPDERSSLLPRVDTGAFGIRKHTYEGAAIGIRGSSVVASSEDEDGDESSVSSSEDSSSNIEEEASAKEQRKREETYLASISKEHPPKTMKYSKKPGNKKRQKDDIVRQMGDPPSVLLLIDGMGAERPKLAMSVPAALLPVGNTGLDSLSICESLLELSDKVTVQSRTVVVLLLSSGRFAGAVFKGDRCIVHRVSASEKCISSVGSDESRGLVRFLMKTHHPRFIYFSGNYSVYSSKRTRWGAIIS